MTESELELKLGAQRPGKLPGLSRARLRSVERQMLSGLQLGVTPLRGGLGWGRTDPSSTHKRQEPRIRELGVLEGQGVGSQL